MVQFSATRCSCIAILRVSLVSFTAITLCVASQRVFIVVVVVVYFVIDSVRKLLDTPSYLSLFSINSIRYVKDNRYRQYFQTFMTVLCVSITQIKHINTNHKRPVRNQESQNKQAPTICTAKYQALV
jgi:hypothetical protein